jgi:hypothetical protein
MDLHLYALTEVRKGSSSSMSRAPDLSAFPIPRKGGAKPIVGDEVEEATAKDRAGEGGGPESSPLTSSSVEASDSEVTTAPRIPSTPKAASITPRSARPGPAPSVPMPTTATYGQTVATTVKLDETRYLRLMEAGKPGPGRLRRRTIQDMLIEALDEWFERRQL